jgi:hypothetical protein
MPDVKLAMSQACPVRLLAMTNLPEIQVDPRGHKT